MSKYRGNCLCRFHVLYLNTMGTFVKMFELSACSPPHFISSFAPHVIFSHSVLKLWGACFHHSVIWEGNFNPSEIIPICKEQSYHGSLGGLSLSPLGSSGTGADVLLENLDWASRSAAGHSTAPTQPLGHGVPGQILLLTCQGWRSAAANSA